MSTSVVTRRSVQLRGDATVARTVRSVPLHLFPDLPSDGVLSAFGICELGHLIRPRGADAENWVATTCSHEEVVLRCDNDPERPLKSAATWCEQLSAAGVPVATARRSIEGEWVYTDTDGVWTCWRHVEGTWPEPCEDTALQAGHLLAQMHAVDVVDEGTPPPALWRWVDALVQVNPVAGAHLCSLTGPKRLCHLDLHFANLISSPQGLVAIDFIDAGFADPLFDVAVCAAFWGVLAGVGGLDSFLNGYSEGRGEIVPLSLVGDAAALMALRCDGTDLATEFTSLHKLLSITDRNEV